MKEFTIEKMKTNDYFKCDNIWDMKECEHTKMWAEEIKDGSRIVYVYKFEGEFLGECDIVIKKEGIAIPEKQAYLSKLIVKKEDRNEGIGTALLNFLLTLYKKKGYSYITLEVNKDNITAVNLYKSFGFEITEENEEEFLKMTVEL